MGTRSFSVTFKQKIVEELLSGQTGAAQLCRLHQIDGSTLRRWRREYSVQGIGAWTPQTSTGEQTTIAELERIIGKITVENMVLKRWRQKAHTRCKAVC